MCIRMTIRMLRERMRLALGPRFDIKEFHAAVLEPGALPMPELAWHIDREIERLSAGPRTREVP